MNGSKSTTAPRFVSCNMHPTLIHIRSSRWGEFTKSFSLCKTRTRVIQAKMGQLLAASSSSNIWVEQELDDSLALLDVIGIARDGLCQMKEHINNIQSALRRSKTQGELEKKIWAYSSFKKKMRKQILKGLKEMKRAQDNSSGSSPVSDSQQDSWVLTGLQEAKVITVSVFESLLVFMFNANHVAARRSLVSRWMKRGKVACEVQAEEMTEIANLEASLHSLSSQKSHQKQESHHAQKQMEDLEKKIEELHENLNCIFRSLIKTRATLLNILSN